MTTGTSLGIKAAVLATDSYREMELWYPVLRLREAGADVAVLGAEKAEYLGVVGYPVIPDVTLDQDADAIECDLLVVPGSARPASLDPRARRALSAVARRARVNIGIGSGADLLGELRRAAGSEPGSDGSDGWPPCVTAADADDLPQRMQEVLAMFDSAEGRR